MSRSIVEYYFEQCPEFVDLLAAIRKKHDPQEYHHLSLFICHILRIPIHEIGLVQLYLLTGKYDPSLYFPKITVVTGEDIYAAEYSDKKAVYLSLMPDSSRDDVIDYVEKNWQEVRQILNNNFPKRKRTTKPIERLNEWLVIADKVRNYKKQGTFSKEDFYADLADDYGIALSDVKLYAKRYRPLIDLKYPSFESDEK